MGWGVQGAKLGKGNNANGRFDGGKIVKSNECGGCVEGYDGEAEGEGWGGVVWTKV